MQQHGQQGERAGSQGVADEAQGVIGALTEQLSDSGQLVSHQPACRAQHALMSLPPLKGYARACASSAPLIMHACM